MSTSCNTHRRAVAWAAACLVLSTIGCGGGQEATVRGTVTLDGQPLARGSVTFLPVENGTGASASINADGSFEARTSDMDGMKAGDYLITVRASAEPAPNPQGGPPIPGKLLTPAKYGRSETSGLKATINRGANDLNLELSSNAT
jgi:hypothetical protein